MAEKKTLKMYTTKAGAKQYGTAEQWEKLSRRVFRNYLKNINSENFQKNSKVRAADHAAFANFLRNEYGSDGKKSAEVFDRLEQDRLNAAEKEKMRSLIKRSPRG